MLSRVEHAHGDDAGRAALARDLMRRQSRLGLRIAAVFVLILVGLPLLNLYVPDVMATPVGGFSLTWLLLAVLFYPVTWLLSWIFVRGSDRIEAALVTEMRDRLASPSPSPALDPSEPSILNPQPIPTKRKLFVEDKE